jgi:hypothetical protein
MGTNIQVPPRELAKNPLNIISPSIFHLNLEINGIDDIALKENFEIQKPLEVLI